MNVTFRGHHMHSSIRLDETTRKNTYIFAVHIQMKKSYSRWKISQQNSKKKNWWPLEVNLRSNLGQFDLNQIWCNLNDGEFNSLSIAVFGFALAIIVPEIMEVFRNDVWLSWRTRNLAIFWPWGPQFGLQRKIDWNSFVLIFDELSNVFPFFFTTNRSRDRRGGGGRTPLPSRWWKICSASGTRVNLRPVGGPKGPPLWFFANSSWSTGNFALKLAIPLRATIPHLVSKN